MKSYFVLAGVLIAAGILALLYGQFSYTTEKQAAKLGPLELTVTEKETVNIPTWAGAGSIATGVALLAFGAMKI
jgi:hypothetical protein